MDTKTLDDKMRVHQEDLASLKMILATDDERFAELKRLASKYWGGDCFSEFGRCECAYCEARRALEKIGR